MSDRKPPQPSVVEATADHPAGMRIGVAARELGIDHSLVRVWLSAGVISAFKIGNVTYLSSDDVQRVAQTPMSQLPRLAADLTSAKPRQRRVKKPDWPL